VIRRESKGDKEKKEPSLEEVIKEAWQKATNPEQIVKSEVEAFTPTK
jgi:IS30 family transposase